jgi:HSP20 family protein
MNLIPTNRITPVLFDELDRFLSRSAPPMDIMNTRAKEMDNEWQLEIDLPGFKREEINIDMAEDYLNVQAKTEDEQRSFRGSVEHRFRLPSDVDASGINARYENGVLCLTVPKRPQQEAEKRRIEIQ